MSSNIESGRSRTKPPGIPFDRIITRGNIVSRNGRPLLEHTADAEVVAQQKAAGISFTRHPNTRQDSRKAYPEKNMNLVALTEIRKNIDPLYDDCAWVNTQYFGDEAPEQISVGQAEDLTLVTTWLPSYLIYRTRDPIHERDVPTNIADLSKATDGIRATTNSMRHNLGETIVDAQRIYEYANTPQPGLKPNLVGDDVCPAKKSEILHTTDALLTKKGGDASRSILDTYIAPGEFPKLQKFSKVAGDIEDLFDVAVDSIRKKESEIKYYRGSGIDPENPSVQATQKQIKTINNNFIAAVFVAEKEFNSILGRDPNTIVRPS